MTKKPDKLKQRAQHFKPEKDEHGKYVFPEEFVFEARPGGIQPNVPSNINGEITSLSDVVGHPFNHANPQSPSYHFDRYARVLMDRIRDYNRALYRLRRAHIFYDHSSGFLAMSPLPDDAPRFNLPASPSDPTADGLFMAIEKEFERISSKLEELLTLPLKNFRNPIDNEMLSFRGNVDCIRVNDYIVSVRIGGEAQEQAFPTDNGKEALNLRLLQPQFSSSSHTSISSAFSSYSSNSSWNAGP